MYYLNCFLIYSIFGFIFETLVAFLSKNNFQSGIMFGPWTPIYGIGTVLILILSDYFFINLHLPRWIETLIVFFIVSIFLSCMELIGGILIESVLHEVFWSYKDHKYNIGNYISLEMTLIWGIASIIFIYIINPICKNFIKRTPLMLSFSILLIMGVDFVTTIIKKIS